MYTQNQTYKNQLLNAFNTLDSNVPTDYVNYLNFVTQKRFKYIHYLNMVLDGFIKVAPLYKTYDLKRLQSEFEIANFNLTMANYNAMSTNRQLHKNYKANADPAIIGGIFNGLLGPAAGVYAAHQTAENNANAKHNIPILENEYDVNKKETIQHAEYLWDLTKKIFYVLFEFPEFETTYANLLEEGKERDYQEAKVLIAESRKDEAKTILKRLGNYKDSEYLLKKLETNWIKCIFIIYLIIFFISFFFSCIAIEF